MSHPFFDPSVKAVFDAYPQAMRGALQTLREAVLDAADQTLGPGATVETLKWKQPAYLPARANVGTTVRIDARRDDPDAYSLYFHCQSRLADEFRQRYAGAFRFEGDRAFIFRLGEPVPWAELGHCVGLALTFHERKRAWPPLQPSISAAKRSSRVGRTSRVTAS